MPWPTDPVRRALAMERHKAAQKARWTDEARRKVSERATAQWSDLAKRKRMSEIKRKVYADNPHLALYFSELMRGRAHPASRERCEALREAWKHKRDKKSYRLALIRNRAVVACANGKKA